MTLAAGKAVMEAAETIKPGLGGITEDFYDKLPGLAVRYMQKFGREHPDVKFNEQFKEWMLSERPQPFDGSGTGASVCVSPAGYIALSNEAAERIAMSLASVTDKSQSDGASAKAAASAVFLARQGALKHEILKGMTAANMKLLIKIKFTLDYNPGPRSSEDTVALAMKSFLKASSFEDAVRIAVSWGGEVSTVAAIAGSVAEAYIGVPTLFKNRIRDFLNDQQLEVVREWESFACYTDEEFKVLTKYIGRFHFTKVDVPGQKEDKSWSQGEPSADPIDETLADDAFSFKAECQNYLHSIYRYRYMRHPEILAMAHVSHPLDNFNLLELDKLDNKTVLDILYSTVSTDYLSDDELPENLKKGLTGLCLRRLKDADWLINHRRIHEFFFEAIDQNQGLSSILIKFYDDGATLTVSRFKTTGSIELSHELSKDKAITLQRHLWGLHIEYWNPWFLENTSAPFKKFKLAVAYSDGYLQDYSGGAVVPENYDKLEKIFSYADSLASQGESQFPEEGAQEDAGIIQFPPFEKLMEEKRRLEEEIVSLYAERSELVYVECRHIESLYMIEVGGIEYKIYELRTRLRRLKRKTALVQKELNFGRKPNLDGIEEQLDTEMRDYVLQEAVYLAKIQNAVQWQKSDKLSIDEAAEVKKIYRQIIKKLHPDIHPNAGKTEAKLFHQAVSAYENGNLGSLKAILVQTQINIPDEEEWETLPKLTKLIETHKETIKMIRDNISKIKSEFPYTMRALLNDKDMMQARKDALYQEVNKLMEAVRISEAKLQGLAGNL
jgi:hypothetical protein